MTKVNEILGFLDSQGYEYRFEGDKLFEIEGFTTPQELTKNCLLWIKKPEKFIEDADGLQDLLVVSDENFKPSHSRLNVIRTRQSRAVFFSILKRFFSHRDTKCGVESSAVVKTAQIGENVYIGHHSYIGEEVVIGDHVTIKHNVVIEGRVTIGNNTMISSGTVIGSDGFGYYVDSNGVNQKIEHFGGVVIGNNVEIGANTCIDRGTLGDTIIEDNVKIDNLCHVAHNVKIGKNTSVIALSMIGGSVELGDSAYIAPAASLINQIKVGDYALVGIGSVVLKDVAENTVVAGCPAKILRKKD